MSDFKSRENASEVEFSFQEKHSFDVEARTSKLFGLWIGGLLGLEGADADTYARTVVEANLEEPGFGDVLSHVKADLDAKGLEYKDEDLHDKLERCLMQAKRELSDN